MSDFVDSEAEESGNESLEEDEDEIIKPSKKKKIIGSDNDEDDDEDIGELYIYIVLLGVQLDIMQLGIFVRKRKCKKKIIKYAIIRSFSVFVSYTNPTTLTYCDNQW